MKIKTLFTSNSGFFLTLVRLLVLTLILVAGNSVALATVTDKYAIVIGNSNYESAPLVNPRNDAVDMAAELASLGYQLHRGKALLDLTLEEFESELREFAFNLSKNSIAVVYYAGHGVSTQTDNYLIPIKASLRWQSQLKTRAVSLRDTVSLLKSRNSDGLNIVLLDACRDNPLEEQFRSGGSRGLVRIGDLARGSFIGYSADLGQLAADGTGRNGVYTEALLEGLRSSPGTPIQLLHNQVAKTVFEKTRNSDNPQFPVSESKFIGRYCFGECDTPGEQQKGYFDVQVSPADAKVCFYLDNWKCGHKTLLPTQREYPVHASADGFESYNGRIRLESSVQKLNLELTARQLESLVQSDTENISESTVASNQPNRNPSHNSVPLDSVVKSKIKKRHIVLGVLAAGLVAALLCCESEPEETFTLNLPSPQ